jgi:hypothetical protein
MPHPEPRKNLKMTSPKDEKTLLKSLMLPEDSIKVLNDCGTFWSLNHVGLSREQWLKAKPILRVLLTLTRKELSLLINSQQ